MGAVKEGDGRLAIEVPKIAPGQMRIIWDAPIEMDDGVTLRANVYLPAEDGRYPAVMAMTSYAKDLPFSQGFEAAWKAMLEAAPEIAEGTSGKYISFEAPDPEKWTPYGYAVILVDARGVGRSPGQLEIHSERQAIDYHDCIEWAGAQAWCSGKVGLLGMSYLGTSQWSVATRRPKYLCAMIPWEAGGALGYHGGIPSSFFRMWYASQVRSVQHGLGSRGYKNVFTGEFVSGDEDLTDERLAANSSPNDIYKQLMQHPLDDEFWDGRRRAFDRIDIPLLSVSSWGAIGIHLRANVEAFVQAACPQKWLWIREAKGTFAGFYADESVTLQRKFFDYTLKGEGDFEQAHPKVLLHVRSVDDETIDVRAADRWPLPETAWTKFYLELTSSTLVDASPEIETSATYRGFSEGITLLTRPFKRETEIMGPLAAQLWVASSTIDADLFLTVRVFAPNGAERFFHGLPDPRIPLTQGWLRCSQRELDNEKSEFYRPVLTHRSVRPLWPGDPYQVDVEIWPTSVVLPAGYRLGLTIEGKDFDHGVPFEWAKGGTQLRGSSLFLHDDPAFRPAEIYDGEITVFGGGDKPSYLLVPVIPRTS